MDALVVLFLIFVYLIPTLVAVMRDHHQTASIVILNLFLGWSGLGWLGALIWAASAVKKEQ